MNKFLNFLILLLISNSLLSQDNENFYVLLDNEDFYKLTKKGKSAMLEIPNYAYREQWNKGKSVKQNIKDDDIVKVEPIPNEKHYNFHTYEKPILKSSIEGIKTYPVIEVSKRYKMFFRNRPYKIVFIEKLKDGNYMFWQMVPIAKE